MRLSSPFIKLWKFSLLDKTINTNIYEIFWYLWKSIFKSLEYFFFHIPFLEIFGKYWSYDVEKGLEGIGFTQESIK